MANTILLDPDKSRYKDYLSALAQIGKEPTKENIYKLTIITSNVISAAKNLKTQKEKRTSPIATLTDNDILSIANEINGFLGNYLAFLTTLDNKQITRENIKQLEYIIFTTHEAAKLEALKTQLLSEIADKTNHLLQKYIDILLSKKETQFTKQNILTLRSIITTIINSKDIKNESIQIADKINSLILNYLENLDKIKTELSKIDITPLIQIDITALIPLMRAINEAKKEKILNDSQSSIIANRIYSIYEGFLSALSQIGNPLNSKNIANFITVTQIVNEAKDSQLLNDEQISKLGSQINGFYQPTTLEACIDIISKNLEKFKDIKNQSHFLKIAKMIRNAITLAGATLYLLPSSETPQNADASEHIFSKQLIGNLLAENKISYELLLNAYIFNETLVSSNTEITQKFGTLLDNLLQCKDSNKAVFSENGTRQFEDKIIKKYRRATPGNYIKYIKTKIEETEKNKPNLTSVKAENPTMVNFEITHFKNAKQCCISGGEVATNLAILRKTVDNLAQQNPLQKIVLKRIGDATSDVFITILPENMSLEYFTQKVQEAIDAEGEKQNNKFQTNFIKTIHLENKPLPDDLKAKIDNLSEVVAEEAPTATLRPQ